MFRRFLVPLDGFDQSEQIGRWANGLATGLGGEIVLFGAVEPGKSGYGGHAAREGSDAWSDSEHSSEEARHYLTAVAEKLAHSGKSPAVEVSEGRPTDAILETARRLEIDVIAIATRRVSALARTVLGSVTDAIVKRSAIPVLVANPDILITFESSPDVPDTVIVPLDGSELSEKSIPHAVSLAALAGARMLCIRSTTMAFASQSGDGASKERQNCLEYLEGFRDQAAEAGVKFECKVPSGTAAGAIIEAAKEESGGLIVMTTHGRTGFRRAVLGSVADQVIRAASAPVLVVPPTDQWGDG